MWWRGPIFHHISNFVHGSYTNTHTNAHTMARSANSTALLAAACAALSLVAAAPVADPLPIVKTEAGCPATAPEGARTSMSCAKLNALRDSSAPSMPIQYRENLGLLQAVLIDDDMKVLNLPCNRFRNF